MVIHLFELPGEGASSACGLPWKEKHGQTGNLMNVTCKRCKKAAKWTMENTFDDNDDVGCLFHLRMILRTKEMADVLEHAREIMRLLEQYKDDVDIQEILSERNDQDFVDKLNR